MSQTISCKELVKECVRECAKELQKIRDKFHNNLHNNELFRDLLIREIIQANPDDNENNQSTITNGHSPALFEFDDDDQATCTSEITMDLSEFKDDDQETCVSKITTDVSVFEDDDQETCASKISTAVSVFEDDSEDEYYLIATQETDERALINYDSKEQRKIDQCKRRFLEDLENLEDDGKLKIYENQENIAEQVVKKFKKRKIINIMVISQTQTGKTGSMCATIKQYLKCSNSIPIENIYIITGLSDNAWLKQTKERIPQILRENVFHRNKLAEFVKRIEGKKNILIIIDEIHVAAKTNQTIHKTFESAGLLNKYALYENDIKILEYSATPDGTIYDLIKWNDASSKILAKAGQGYVSSYDLFLLGRVKQYKDLCGCNVADYLLGLDKTKIFESLEIDSEKLSKFIERNAKNDLLSKREFNETLFANFIRTNNYEQYSHIINLGVINKLYTHVKSIYQNISELKNEVDKYEDHLYHIIRTKNSDGQDLTIRNFKKIFDPNEYNFIKYDGKNKIRSDTEDETNDINTILIVRPRKHTFIFIKEMLRCSKTLEKRYKGISYERYTSTLPDDSTIIQGLIGRDTGYDNNGISICYTNIDSIIRYRKLWKSKFEDKTIEWNSKTTKCANSNLVGNNTFNDTKIYSGFGPETNETDESDVLKISREPIIQICCTQEEGKKYYKDNLKEKLKNKNGRGPKQIFPDENGFYKANIRGNKKVYSCEEMFREQRCNIDNGAGYAFRPCYRNVDDKSTLEWWFIHYQK